MKTLLVANFVAFIGTVAIWVFTYHISKDSLASSSIATSSLLMVATWSWVWVKIRQNKVMGANVPTMRIWSSILMVYAGMMLLITVEQAVAPVIHNFAILLLAFIGPLFFIGSNVIEASVLAECDMKGSMRLRRAPNSSELIVAALPASFPVGVVLYIFLRLRWQELRDNSQSEDMASSYDK